MDKAPVNVDLLFETSWEVCNKIGGIYTVLSTKAKTLQKLYKDKVIFIGPDVWSDDNPSPYFVPSNTLLKGWKAQAKLPDGVSVRVGRWDIPGRPIVVLVKFDGMYAVKMSSTEGCGICIKWIHCTLTVTMMKVVRLLMRQEW